MNVIKAMILEEIDNLDDKSITVLSEKYSPSTDDVAVIIARVKGACAITVSGLEELQNTGDDAIRDLVRSRVANAVETLNAAEAQGII